MVILSEFFELLFEVLNVVFFFLLFLFELCESFFASLFSFFSDPVLLIDACSSQALYLHFFPLGFVQRLLNFNADFFLFNLRLVGDKLFELNF